MTNFAIAIAAAAVGLFLPGGILSESAASLIVTFFGLVAAGLLPAISLVVANVLSGSRSVAKLVALKHELDLLLSGMMRLLALLCAGALLTVVYELDFTLKIPAFELLGHKSPEWLTDAPERVLQALIFATLVVSLNRTRLIAVAFKMVLLARYELAVSNSRQRLRDRAPSDDEVKSAFPTSEKFGERVKLD